MLRLALVRHAPTRPDGRMTGRREVDADCAHPAALDRLRQGIGALAPAQVWTSPARRCLQTCAALGLNARILPDLVEQSFGEWEGARYDELPDLGPLGTGELARHRPPGGESFLDMTARVRPLLDGAKDDTLIVAHAGTIRAALSLVVGDAALSFAAAPLSLTVLIRAGGIWSVERVNCGGIA
ncbi:histidine phosphatase family protein [uncultured Paracoccus sp.]|uniref:histidine phosphatase family protein n=1 Tax=uncultured Paracoccus sp. TaxID=189685 RepID=UPI00344504E8